MTFLEVFEFFEMPMKYTTEQPTYCMSFQHKLTTSFGGGRALQAVDDG
jgi:hypothetical protein